MKGRGDKARRPADEFIGRARKQIEKPVLVGRIYREDIYKADHAVRSSLLLPEALPTMKVGALAPGDIDCQLTKMTLLGHMRKRLKSVVECKFAIHHRGDAVLLDEPIHVFEILA